MRPRYRTSRTRLASKRLVSRVRHASSPEDNAIEQEYREYLIDERGSRPGCGAAGCRWIADSGHLRANSSATGHLETDRGFEQRNARPLEIDVRGSRLRQALFGPFLRRLGPRNVDFVGPLRDL